MSVTRKRPEPIERPRFGRALAHSALVGGVLLVLTAILAALLRISWAQQMSFVTMIAGIGVSAWIIYALLVYALPPRSPAGTAWSAVLAGYTALIPGTVLSVVLTPNTGGFVWLPWWLYAIVIYTLLGVPVWCALSAAMFASTLDPRLSVPARQDDGRVHWIWRTLTIGGAVVAAIVLVALWSIARGAPEASTLILLATPALVALTGAIGWIVAARSPRPGQSSSSTISDASPV